MPSVPRSHAACAGLAALTLGMLVATACAASKTTPQEPPAPAPPTIPLGGREYWLHEPVFGGRLHVVESGPRDAPCVVLVHGLGEAGLLDWDRVLPPLSTNYHVVAFDLPGFGRSDAPPGVYSPANYSRLIEWLIDEVGGRPAIVIGHSLGAAISLRFAVDHPDTLIRLILIDAAGILQRTVFVSHMARLRSDEVESSLFGRWWDAIARKLDIVSESALGVGDHMPAFEELLAIPPARQYLFKDRPTLNAGLALMDEDFSLAVREIEVPVHIIWGESDPVAPLRTGRLLAGLLPEAELHVLPDTRHVPMTEHPEIFNRLLERALVDPPRPTPALALEPGDADLDCENRSNQVFSGRYRHIRLRDCRNIRLVDIAAETLTLVESTAVLENVTIDSSDVAVRLDESRLEGTLVSLRGTTAIVSRESRIDLAGAIVETSDEIVRSIGESRAYFSVSIDVGAGSPRSLHGAYLLEDEAF